MKKTIFIILASALVGCCNTRVCREGGRDVVEVSNSSWRFLGLWAIASGNPEKPNRNTGLCFRDSLPLADNLMMLFLLYTTEAADDLTRVKLAECRIKIQKILR